MANEDVTLGEVYRAVLDIKTNMVTKETNAVVVAALRGADGRNGEAIKELQQKFADAEKDIKSAGRAKVNMFIAAVLAVAGSVLVKLFLPDAS